MAVERLDKRDRTHQTIKGKADTNTNTKGIKMNKSEVPASIRKWHAIIDEIVDERSDDNGYWIYLKSGYVNTMHDVHHIHENTLSECVEQLRDFVEPCKCSECNEDSENGLKLTDLEKFTVDSLIRQLDGERDFSAVAPEDLAADTKIPMQQIRGVLSSLVKKEIIHIDQRHKDVSIVYLRQEFYSLHPVWSK